MQDLFSWRNISTCHTHTHSSCSLASWFPGIALSLSFKLGPQMLCAVFLDSWVWYSCEPQTWEICVGLCVCALARRHASAYLWCLLTFSEPVWGGCSLTSGVTGQAGGGSGGGGKGAYFGQMYPPLWKVLLDTHGGLPQVDTSVPQTHLCFECFDSSPNFYSGCVEAFPKQMMAPFTLCLLTTTYLLYVLSLSQQVSSRSVFWAFCFVTHNYID